MQTLSQPRSAGGAQKYYMHMEKDSMGRQGEYYAAEGVGYWTGDAARAFGLEGAVTPDAFKQLTEGRDLDGNGLVANAGDPDRRAGWDATFSAPKSVSVVWSVAPPEVQKAIEQAHQNACEQAFKFIQDHAALNRHGEHVTLVAAAFQHGTSREQDAQLHSHYFVMNIGMDANGKTSTLESQPLFDYKMAGGAAYQAALAHEIKALGYSIERDGDSFRITTVPKSLEYDQSTRRQQIEARLAEKGESGGAAASIANLETRKAKEVVPLSVLRTEWAEKAARHGFGPEQAKPDYRHTTLEKTYDHSSSAYDRPDRAGLSQPGLGEIKGLSSIDTLNNVRELSSLSLDGHQERPEMLLQGHARDELDQGRPNGADRLRWAGAVPATEQSVREALEQGALPAPGIEEVLNQATEHEAVIDAQDVHLAAFRQSIGVQSLEAARALADKAMEATLQIQKQDGTGPVRLTTDTMIRAERDVIEIAGRRSGEDMRVSPELIRDAIAQIEAEKSLENGKPFTFSPEQREAVEILCGQIGATQVLIGDAGTGKSTTLAAVRVAHEMAGYRVIGASTSGKAASELQTSSGIASDSLAQLQADLRTGKDSLDSHTVVVVDEAGMTDSRAMALVMRQAQEAGAKVLPAGDYKQLQPVGAGATFYRLSKEVRPAELTENRRQKSAWERQAVKSMSKGESTKALAIYAKRGKVHVHRDFKATVKELATKQVQNIDKVGAANTLAIAATNLAVREINTAIREQLQQRGELANERTVETAKGTLTVAEGDRILMRAGDRDGGYKNGDLGTVLSLSDKDMVLKIDRTGAEARIEFSKADMAHGYAITTHKAQGATVDLVTVYLTHQSSREMAYVQASRSRHGTEFYLSTHHLKEMRASAASTPEMRLAVDRVIDARVEAGKPPGITPEARENYAKALNYLEKNAAYGDRFVISRTLHEQLKDIAKAMSISKQKETTLDYRIVQTENQKTTQRGDEVKHDLNKAFEEFKQAIELVKHPYEDKQNRTPDELHQHAQDLREAFVQAAARDNPTVAERMTIELRQAAVGTGLANDLTKDTKEVQSAIKQEAALKSLRDFKNNGDKQSIKEAAQALRGVEKEDRQAMMKEAQLTGYERQTLGREVEKEDAIVEIHNWRENEDLDVGKADLADTLANLREDDRQEVYKEVIKEVEQQPGADVEALKAEIRELEAEVSTLERERDSIDLERSGLEDMVLGENYQQEQAELEAKVDAASMELTAYEVVRDEAGGPNDDLAREQLDKVADALENLPSWRQEEVLERTSSEIRDEVVATLDERDRSHDGPENDHDHDNDLDRDRDDDDDYELE